MAQTLFFICEHPEGKDWALLTPNLPAQSLTQAGECLLHWIKMQRGTGHVCPPTRREKAADPGQHPNGQWEGRASEHLVFCFVFFLGGPQLAGSWPPLSPVDTNFCDVPLPISLSFSPSGTPALSNPQAALFSQPSPGFPNFQTACVFRKNTVLGAKPT